VRLFSCLIMSPFLSLYLCCTAGAPFYQRFAVGEYLFSDEIIFGIDFDSMHFVKLRVHLSNGKVKTDHAVPALVPSSVSGHPEVN
jgi:hypothetical protein